MNKTPVFFRYLFLGLWFLAVPLALAVLAVHLIAAPETGTTPGPFGWGRDFVRDQTFPAGIILFTAFEMVLYSFRHHLPLADKLSVGGRQGLPASLRRDYEAAAHLLEESERILEKKQAAIQREVPASTRRELSNALDELKAVMRREPFDEHAFTAAFDRASDLAEHLHPWRKSEIREYVESIGVAVLVALLLRAVVVEAFKIPSGSMLPTLQIDDHIFVNKFIYGPVVPVADVRLFESMPPGYGDVIVFEFPDPNPNNERQDFIKRVVGLPGDILEADGGHPIINGWKVPNCRVGLYHYNERIGEGPPRTAELFVEYLGEHAYLTLFEAGAFETHQGPYEVQPGEVWVFGDNRHNSSDSRAWYGGRGGGVPFDNIKGRAMFVWLPPARLFVDVMGRPELPDGAPREMVEGIDRCLAERPPPSETTPPEPEPPAL